MRRRHLIVSDNSYIVYHYDEWDNDRVNRALSIIDRVAPGLSNEDSADLNYIKDILSKLNEREAVSDE